MSSTPVVVNKKALTITAEDKLNIIKGSPMPEFTYKVECLVKGDIFMKEHIKTSLNINTENPISIELSFY